VVVKVKDFLLVKKAKKGEDGRQLVNPFSEGL
jgi:hypothetical protein